MKKKPSKKGGARPGAGRKPREIKKVTISVQVEPEIADKFRAECKARGISQPEQITRWIKKMKKS